MGDNDMSKESSSPEASGLVFKIPGASAVLKKTHASTSQDGAAGSGNIVSSPVEQSASSIALSKTVSKTGEVAVNTNNIEESSGKATYYAQPAPDDTGWSPTW